MLSEKKKEWKLQEVVYISGNGPSLLHYASTKWLNKLGFRWMLDKYVLLDSCLRWIKIRDINYLRIFENRFHCCSDKWKSDFCLKNWRYPCSCLTLTIGFGLSKLYAKWGHGITLFRRYYVLRLERCFVASYSLDAGQNMAALNQLLFICFGLLLLVVCVQPVGTLRYSLT